MTRKPYYRRKGSRIIIESKDKDGKTVYHKQLPTAEKLLTILRLEEEMEKASRFNEQEKSKRAFNNNYTNSLNEEELEEVKASANKIMEEILGDKDNKKKV